MGGICVQLEGPVLQRGMGVGVEGGPGSSLLVEERLVLASLSDMLTHVVLLLNTEELKACP